MVSTDVAATNTTAAPVAHQILDPARIAPSMTPSSSRAQPEPKSRATPPLLPTTGLDKRRSTTTTRCRALEPLCEETWRVSDGWQRGALILEPDADRLAGAAARIAEAFRTSLEAGDESSETVYAYRPCHRVVLDLEQVADATPWSGIPLDARIVQGADHTSSYTLGLFRNHEGKGEHAWGDLLAEVDGADAPWRHDLDQAFVDGLGAHLWDPSRHTLEAWYPGSGEQRRYQPVLYEIERRKQDDRPVGATVLLLPA